MTVPATNISTVLNSETFLSWLTTANSAYAQTNELTTNHNTLSSDIGVLASLATTDKSTIVNAINELRNKLDATAPFSKDLNMGNHRVTNMAQGVDDGDAVSMAQLNTLTASLGIGDLATLTTTAKNTLVAAVNELDAGQGDLSTLTTTATSDLVAAINELDSGQGVVSTLATSDKSNLVAAINEVVGDLGALSGLDTTDITSLVAAINEQEAERGDIANLTTSVKTSVVNAINELDAEHGVLSTLTTAQKGTLVGAINELDAEHGVLTTLTTSAKNTLVAAINELDGEIGTVGSLTTSASTVTTAINELDAEHGVLTTLTTTQKGTLVGAINELDAEHGVLTTLTTTAKNTLVAAINEINAALAAPEAHLAQANNLSDVASTLASHDTIRKNGASIASAATVNLDNATGVLLDITGTTTTTAITLAQGKERIVRCAGAWPITAGASLIISNVTSGTFTFQAGDLLHILGYASGVVRVNKINGGAGIDDNATSNALTVAADGSVSIGSLSSAGLTVSKGANDGKANIRVHPENAGATNYYADLTMNYAETAFVMAVKGIPFLKTRGYSNLTSLNMGVAGHGELLTLVNTGRIGVNTTAPSFKLDVNGSIGMTEKAATPAPSVAGKGQLWIKNDAPNSFMFTDDADVDHTVMFSEDAKVTEQADAVWEAGTGTTPSIVAPDAIAAAIAAQSGGGGADLFSLNEVGSFAQMRHNSGNGLPTIQAGGTIAGSKLRFAGMSSGSILNGWQAPSGTWRCHGYLPASTAWITVFQRIA